MNQAKRNEYQVNLPMGMLLEESLAASDLISSLQTSTHAIICRCHERSIEFHPKPLIIIVRIDFKINKPYSSP
jgi:hypothetical protein